MSINHGDIILTRNINKRGKNVTPGYWNHSAVIVNCDNDLYVVEVHFKNDTVIAVPFYEFEQCYPEWVILRIKDDSGLDGHFIGDFAVNCIGIEIDYAVTRIRTHGREVGIDNCTSFVRKCVENGLDINCPWTIPDDIARCERLKTIANKRNNL